MAADECAQRGVHHPACRCIVTRVPTVGVDRLPDDPAPSVVCASCGRTKDRPPRDGIGRECEVPEWHQPQPYVPDADVTAEDGDDLAPLTEEDILAAVGPEPGKTWAELYARAALQLSYRTAELHGAQQELDRLRAAGTLAAGALVGEGAMALAVLVQRGDGDSVALSREELEAAQGCRIRAWVVPATGEVRLAVER